MKDRSRDEADRMRPTIEAELGHLLIEDVDTSSIDAFKTTLPSHLEPKSKNQYLIFISSVLQFMKKRDKLKALPYIPREREPKVDRDWYIEAERDRLLDGMYRFEREWYLFFYLTCRLGLRRGEVYAVARSRIREEARKILIDRAVQPGKGDRPSKVITRKNDEAYTLDVSEDVLGAIRWHIEQGYAGPEFLFSKTGQFTKYLDSHVGPLERVQQKLGLRRLSHHLIGRHSVGSQAGSAGASMKAIQAQLGHRSEASTYKYVHLGVGAQLRLVDSLKPSEPPHLTVNPASTTSERVNENMLQGCDLDSELASA